MGPRRSTTVRVVRHPPSPFASQLSACRAALQAISTAAPHLDQAARAAEALGHRLARTPAATGPSTAPAPPPSAALNDDRAMSLSPAPAPAAALADDSPTVGLRVVVEAAEAAPGAPSPLFAPAASASGPRRSPRLASRSPPPAALSVSLTPASIAAAGRHGGGAPTSVRGDGDTAMARGGLAPDSGRRASAGAAGGSGLGPGSRGRSDTPDEVVVPTLASLGLSAAALAALQATVDGADAAAAAAGPRRSPRGFEFARGAVGADHPLAPSPSYASHQNAPMTEGTPSPLSGGFAGFPALDGGAADASTPSPPPKPAAGTRPAPPGLAATPDVALRGGGGGGVEGGTRTTEGATGAPSDPPLTPTTAGLVGRVFESGAAGAACPPSAVRRPPGSGRRRSPSPLGGRGDGWGGAAENAGPPRGRPSWGRLLTLIIVLMHKI